MVKKSEADQVLYSWKEIAKYLNVESRTCQIWEKEYGLPVKRFTDSPKSRVFVNKKDIDNWLEQRNGNGNNLPDNSPRSRVIFKRHFIISLILLVFISVFFTIFYRPDSSSNIKNLKGSIQNFPNVKVIKGQIIKNWHFDPLKNSTWTVIGNPGHRWKQCNEKFLRATVIVSENHIGDNVLRQEIAIPEDATILRWNISPTRYGKEADQTNARVSIKFKGSYILRNFDPPAGVIEHDINVDITSLRGQTGVLDLIHHESSSWGLICSDLVLIENTPISDFKVDWKKLNINTNPTLARAYSQMVYNSNKGVIVLFGGCPSNDKGLNDMWSYDGKNWAFIKTSNAPDPRYSHNMAYINEADKIILFGGERWPKIFGDTWEFNCSSGIWKKIETKSAPGPRAHFAMAYDSKRKKLVLFGGYSKFRRNLGDTWEYDCDEGSETFQQWKEVTDLDPYNSPPSRQSMSLVYDSINQVMVLFGGLRQFNHPNRLILNDTWEWNGEKWLNTIPHKPAVFPTPRHSYFLCFNRDREKTFLYGGTDLNGVHNDSWEYDGSKKIWKKVLTPKQPSLRSHTAIEYFPENKSIMLFGGGLGFNRKWLADTWELSSINPE